MMIRGRSLETIMICPCRRSQEGSYLERDQHPEPPVCPSMAGKMCLEGTVMLLATVAPDGTVNSLQVRGGHPLIAKCC